MNQDNKIFNNYEICKKQMPEFIKKLSEDIKKDYIQREFVIMPEGMESALTYGPVTIYPYNKENEATYKKYLHFLEEMNFIELQGDKGSSGLALFFKLKQVFVEELKNDIIE